MLFHLEWVCAMSDTELSRSRGRIEMWVPAAEVPAAGGETKLLEIICPGVRAVGRWRESRFGA